MEIVVLNQDVMLCTDMVQGCTRMVQDKERLIFGGGWQVGMGFA